MLSGYDFSNCDIPVRLNHFLLVDFEVDVKVLQKFLNIRRQEAVLRKAVLWRGSNAVKMQQLLDKKRVPFPYWSPVGKLKPGELSVRSWVSSGLFYLRRGWNQKHKRGLERLWWRGCSVRLAWDARATSPTDDHHSHTKAMAGAEGQPYPGGGWGVGGVMWRQTF